jgi:hypothetical protein
LRGLGRGGSGAGSRAARNAGVQAMGLLTAFPPRHAAPRPRRRRRAQGRPAEQGAPAGRHRLPCRRPPQSAPQPASSRARAPRSPQAPRWPRAPNALGRSPTTAPRCSRACPRLCTSGCSRASPSPARGWRRASGSRAPRRRGAWCVCGGAGRRPCGSRADGERRPAPPSAGRTLRTDSARPDPAPSRLRPAARKVGHVLGLGDRHGENIMINAESGGGVGGWRGGGGGGG